MPAKEEVEGSIGIPPMDTGIITSSFGERYNPISGKSEFHNGIDIGVPEGTAVKAAADGTITQTGSSSSWGNYIRYNIGGEKEIMYAHLKDVYVTEGENVVAGQKIGEAGSTGYSTGPHLHYSVFENGKEIDPIKFVDYGVTDEVLEEYKARGEELPCN